MDNHATTPLDRRVLDAMIPYFTDKFGNAASRNHSFGWEAEEAVDKARNQIAALINAKSKEIIFTSGATESDNLAVKGIVEFYKDKGNHVITCVTEHKAILDTCRALERMGKATVTYVPVDKYGMVDPDDVRKAITDKTVLISIMYANNEIGTIHPIAEIGEIAKEKGIIFHSDATQGVGKVPVDVERDHIDLMSMSAHKIYGPKGIGALYVRSKGPRVRLTAQMDGGGHERGMRSGTLNVTGIVGLGKACEIAGAEMSEESRRLIELRGKLQAGIFERLDEVYLNGHPTERLPGNLNLSFAYVEGESLLMGISELVDVIWIKVDNSANIPQVTSSLDEGFANSSSETLTEPEAAFYGGFIAGYRVFFQLAELMGIVVVFTIGLVAANTAAMSIRERRTEIAVLRSIGFPAHTILSMLLAESLIIALAGGLLGCGAAYLLLKLITVQGVVGAIQMPAPVLFAALGAAALIGLLSALVPAAAAARRNIVDTIRAVA
jgi:cysteine desulfurase